MTAWISEHWASLPTPIRKFVVDAVEGGIVAIAVLNIAVPHTLTEATAQGLIVATALASPLIAAARRDILPAVLEWWASVRLSSDG